jgi:alkylation response protein AidB-like acyl-CoA dehydrogenase
VVTAIADTFGPDYYQQQVDHDGNCAELWNTLGDKGFLGVHLPEEYGGGGRGLSELAAVLEETAIAGCPLQSIIFSGGVTGTVLERNAAEEQKHRWLPGVASGRTRLSFAITEPDAGCNAHRIATTAKRVGDRYVLNGQKVFITGMESAQWVMVVARTGTDERSGRNLLSVFMVETNSPGLSFEPIRTVMNQPDKSHQVFFDNVEVPAENLIGEENRGLRVAFTGLNTERILTSSICTGIGRYALRKAVRYANDRKVWGLPIGAHQGVAHPLAAGLEALDAAISIHGGNGVTYEYQLAPYFWVVRMLNMGPVSKEMILNFVAEHSLGLPRSY